MAINTTQSKVHWNYFLALERDMETLSRYVEFSQPNFGVYSIELAHLLFAASSEVEVVAKQLCQQAAPSMPRRNINEYKAALLSAIPDLPDTEVVVPRYGLSFRPWDNWRGPDNPDWWRSYNNVKHERDAHFHEATLKNALNALGALLILTFHYYSRHLSAAGAAPLGRKDTTIELVPESTLLRLQGDYYYETVVT